jgi:universal stress protein E
MQKFHNILFISRGLSEETDALKQALNIARSNKAALKVLIIYPEFPNEFANYRDNYEASLLEQVQNAIQASRIMLKVKEKTVPVEIALESGDTPAIRIIRNVIKGQHDLVLKEAHPKESNQGFKAIDMELLRKCPCPVWLSRQVQKSSNEIQIAVAIDPQNIAPEGHDLSLRLLELSRSLANTFSGELNILSCWDYEYEGYLRRNVWVTLPEEELFKIVMDTQSQHRGALDALIRESGISGNIHVHHLRGDPQQIIPQYTEDNHIDILVMGTVARTGIRSFIIGNTAENILQKLGCSLIALKPNGFVSPVKAY